MHASKPTANNPKILPGAFDCSARFPAYMLAAASIQQYGLHGHETCMRGTNGTEDNQVSLNFAALAMTNHASPPAAPDPRLTKSLVLTCAPQGLRAGRQATSGLWVLWVKDLHTIANASFKKVFADDAASIISVESEYLLQCGDQDWSS